MTKLPTLLLFAVLVLGPALTADAQPSAVVLETRTLTFDPPPLVGALTKATATVVNHGSVDAVVTVDFSYGDGTPLASDGNPGGLSSSFTQRVPAGAEMPFALQFTPPAQRRGPVEIQAVASSASAASPSTLRVPTFVLDPKLNLTFEDAPPLDVLPAGTSFLRFTVRNDGNANDTPRLKADLAAPWNATIADAMPMIPAGASAMGIVVVSTTAVNDSQPLFLNVTATSTIRGSATAAAPLLRANATVSRLPRGLRVDGLPAAQLQAFANATTNVTFALNNTGYARDVFVVNTTLGRAGATPLTQIHVNATDARGLLLQNGTDTWVALDANGSINVTAQLQTPADLGRNGTLALRVNATSANALLLSATQPDAQLRVAREIALLPPAPVIAIVDLTAPDPLYKGDTALVTIAVANLGLANATNATLHASLRDNLRSVSERDLAVPALAAGNATNLSFTLQLADLRGTYVLTATLFPNASDAAASPPPKPMDLEIHVRAPALSWHAPPEISVTPGARLMILAPPAGLALVNDGDDAERVTVTLTSSASWLAQSWTLTLPAGATTAVPLSIDVPAFPGVSGANGHLHAASVLRPAFAADTDVLFRVHDDQPPVVELVPFADGARVQHAVRIQARIQDATGVSRAQAYVHDPAGAVQAIDLRPGDDSPDLYVADFTPKLAGNHTIEIHVEDATPDRLETVLRAIPLAVSPGSYRGLAPANFEDTGVVHSRTLRFADDPTDRTVAATIDAGDGPHALLSPFAYTAAGWGAGQHTIAVNATDADGNAVRSSWTVTLDLTAPTFQNVKVTPETDGTSTVDVVVANASDVVARVPGSSAEVSLRPTSAGHFSGRLTLPGDWKQLTVVARNGDSLESATTVDNARHATPGAGAVWVVGAAALLALAGRRSRR